jgi:hypothetical protein
MLRSSTGASGVIEFFEQAGVKPSCRVNGLLMSELRPIADAINEHGWELVPHNCAQNDLLTDYAADPDAERGVGWRARVI